MLILCRWVFDFSHSTSFTGVGVFSILLGRRICGERIPTFYCETCGASRLTYPYILLVTVNGPSLPSYNGLSSTAAPRPVRRISNGWLLYPTILILFQCLKLLSLRPNSRVDNSWTSRLYFAYLRSIGGCWHTSDSNHEYTWRCP